MLWLIPTLPFLGAVLLVLFGSRLPKLMAALIGCGSIGLSAIITLVIGYNFLYTQETLHHIAWTWFSVGELSTQFAFHLDALSLVFIFVITFVGFLIHVYSVEFMH